MSSSATISKELIRTWPLDPTPQESFRSSHIRTLPYKNVSVAAQTNLRLQAKTEFEYVIQVLRVKLTQTMRITLRAVDWTAKACASAHTEIDLCAASEYNKLSYLSDSILATCQKLRDMEQVGQRRRILIEDVETISGGLCSACRHAHHVFLELITLRGEDLHERLKHLAPMGEYIARSLRLCVVGFVNREIGHVIAAISGISDWRRTCAQIRETRSAMADSWKYQSVVGHMTRMMESVHTVALQLSCAAIYGI